MTQFLKAHCGATQMLLDVSRVLEVRDPPPRLEGEARPVHSNALVHPMNWREQIVYCVDMPRYLGLLDTTPGRLIVVESGIEDPAWCVIALAVEGSDHLLSLESNAIGDLADQHANLQPVFSGVYSPVDSPICLLTLRFPANWLLPLVAGVESP